MRPFVGACILAGTIAVYGLAAVGAATLVDIIDAPDLPACTEDEVIVGTGDYRGSTGTWTSYGCLHIDAL